MKFELKQATEILSQTPFTLQRMLEGLSDDWTTSSGNRESWGVYDVIGHLVHGEETDWITRAGVILAQGEDRRFVPFDRVAQFELTNDRSLSDLLTEFAHLRNTNLKQLERMELTAESLSLKGIHPEFGEVSLEQLLATWVVHDLNHVAQIAKILAKKYDAEVGPWKQYLSVLK
jgi:hypothetical protein